MLLDMLPIIVSLVSILFGFGAIRTPHRMYSGSVSSYLIFSRI
jgi:hypothetical protein